MVGGVHRRGSGRPVPDAAVGPGEAPSDAAELVALVEGWALRRPPPRIAEVHREAVQVALEQGWPAPSYPVVRRIIAGLDRGLVALAHGGPGEYRDSFELVLRRESAHPNDLWQADHTELDVMVLDLTNLAHRCACRPRDRLPAA